MMFGSCCDPNAVVFGILRTFSEYQNDFLFDVDCCAPKHGFGVRIERAQFIENEFKGRWLGHISFISHCRFEAGSVESVVRLSLNSLIYSLLPTGPHFAINPAYDVKTSFCDNGYFVFNQFRQRFCERLF
jgi:hypothetical protein